MGNGVDRVECVERLGDVVPGERGELDYPLSPRLADLADAIGVKPAEFGSAAPTAIDDTAFQVVLWRVVSSVRVLKSQGAIMLMAAAMCMVSPPTFQIGPKTYDRRTLPPSVVRLAA